VSARESTMKGSRFSTATLVCGHESVTQKCLKPDAAPPSGSSGKKRSYDSLGKMPCVTNALTASEKQPTPAAASTQRAAFSALRTSHRQLENTSYSVLLLRGMAWQRSPRPYSMGAWTRHDESSAVGPPVSQFLRRVLTSQRPLLHGECDLRAARGESSLRLCS
jgi:hypothetical protein